MINQSDDPIQPAALYLYRIAAKALCVIEVSEFLVQHTLNRPSWNWDWNWNSINIGCYLTVPTFTDVRSDPDDGSASREEAELGLGLCRPRGGRDLPRGQPRPRHGGGDDPEHRGQGPERPQPQAQDQQVVWRGPELGWDCDVISSQMCALTMFCDSFILFILEQVSWPGAIIPKNDSYPYLTIWVSF